LLSSLPLGATDLSGKCAEINSLIATAFAKHPIGGVAIGVVSRSQLACTGSRGDADMEKHTPADQNTVYRIGSVTKMFTVLMLEQLTEAGIVSLSDPVEKCFPEVNRGSSIGFQTPPPSPCNSSPRIPLD
jgi:CubicO group peptidase (beta-lactamase class C family)